jgi:hypothetical protein
MAVWLFLILSENLSLDLFEVNTVHGGEDTEAGLIKKGPRFFNDLWIPQNQTAWIELMAQADTARIR